jgi:hypothetical protein
MPLASMCFLALWRVARWNSKPSVANALAAGCAIGLASLTKQMGVIYLAPSLFLVLLQQLSKRDLGRFIQFSYGLGLAAILFLSWLLPNLANITKQLVLDEQMLASQGNGFPLWLRNFELYFRDTVRLPVPVIVVFVLSLFNVPAQKKLWLPASTFVGFFVLCTLRWDAQEARYVLPLFGYFAYSIAALLVRVWQSGLSILRILDAAFGLYVITIYFVYNFTPYPFPLCVPKGLLNPQFNGLNVRWDGVYPSNPDPQEPFAYNWLLERVQNEQPNHPPMLLVAVNNPNCEITSIKYLARQRRIPLRFCMLAIGEVSVCRCNPIALKLDPDWYLTTRNDQSIYRMHFISEDEFKRFNELKKHFETSGAFAEAGEFLLPDGKTYLVLYRKVVPKLGADNLL